MDLREPAQVNCCPGAVGDEEGTISLYLTEDSSLTSTLKPTEVKVRVRTVDSVVASVRKWQGETPLNFCRLNIQGGELAAL